MICTHLLTKRAAGCGHRNSMAILGIQEAPPPLLSLTRRRQWFEQAGC